MHALYSWVVKLIEKVPMKILHKVKQQTVFTIWIVQS